jgi:hypothetical protein
MAFFSRRAIQELIDESYGFLSQQEILRKLRNLDACSDNTIPTEWELPALVAFSKLGTVSAEPETGTTRPRVDSSQLPRQNTALNTAGY